MSARDDSNGGRYEPMTRPAAGPGMACASQCDECGSRGIAAGRRRMKVARGPLRGLVGNVCAACVALRKKETA